MGGALEVEQQTRKCPSSHPLPFNLLSPPREIGALALEQIGSAVSVRGRQSGEPSDLVGAQQAALIEMVDRVPEGCRLRALRVETCDVGLLLVEVLGHEALREAAFFIVRRWWLVQRGECSPPTPADTRREERECRPLERSHLLAALQQELER